jgi:DNA polymerase
MIDESTGSLRFWGTNQKTRNWERLETWGGRLVENIVQAYARDILAEAMLRLEDAGHKVVFSVHDEVIVEAPEGVDVAEIQAIMAQPISWAPGMTKYLHADGYATPFYKKD